MQCAVYVTNELDSCNVNLVVKGADFLLRRSVYVYIRCYAHAHTHTLVRLYKNTVEHVGRERRCFFMKHTAVHSSHVAVYVCTAVAVTPPVQHSIRRLADQVRADSSVFTTLTQCAAQRTLNSQMFVKIIRGERL